eukprot:SAG31_NODE_2767_length_5122_cov_7.978101_2_plen_65_part_00
MLEAAELLEASGARERRCAANVLCDEDANVLWTLRDSRGFACVQASGLENRKRIASHWLSKSLR